MPPQAARVQRTIARILRPSSPIHALCAAPLTDTKTPDPELGHDQSEHFLGGRWTTGWQPPRAGFTLARRTPPQDPHENRAPLALLRSSLARRLRLALGFEHPELRRPDVLRDDVLRGRVLLPRRQAPPGHERPERDLQRLRSVARGRRAAEQLTSSAGDATFSVDWFPKDDRFCSRPTRATSSATSTRTPGRETLDLTPGTNLKASFAGWHADGGASSLTNERDPVLRRRYHFVGAGRSRPRWRTRSPRFSARAPVPEPGRLRLSGVSATAPGWCSPDQNNADSDLFLARTKLTELVSITPQGLRPEQPRETPDGSASTRPTRAASSPASEHDIANQKRKLVLTADWGVTSCSFGGRALALDRGERRRA
jgi:hypothetical protein